MLLFTSRVRNRPVSDHGIHTADQFIELSFFEEGFSFTDCKMDCIDCNWLWNIWLEFLKVVWMDCPEKTFHAVWMGKFIRSQCGSSAEGANGLDPLESHRLKRLSGPDVAKLRNATPYFWWNVATHYQALVKVDITGVTQGAISKILKQARQTGSPNQKPLGYLLAAGDP